MTARVILDRKARLLRNDMRKLSAKQVIPQHPMALMKPGGPAKGPLASPKKG